MERGEKTAMILSLSLFFFSVFGCVPQLVGLPWWLRQWRTHPPHRRPGFDPWVGKIPWRKALGLDNPPQNSCLENPMDRGAWQATVHGWQKVRHNRAMRHSSSCRILVPSQGLNLGPQEWKHTALATGPPGNSLSEKLTQEGWYLKDT